MKTIEQAILEQSLKDWKKLNKLLNARGNNDEQTYDIIHYEIKLINCYLKKMKDAQSVTINPDGTTFQPAFINMYEVAELLDKKGTKKHGKTNTKK